MVDSDARERINSLRAEVRKLYEKVCCSSGVSIPLSQVAYGTGTGITSDANFTRTASETKIGNGYFNLENNSTPSFAGGANLSGSWTTGSTSDFILINVLAGDNTKENSSLIAGFLGDGGLFYAGYDHIGMSFSPLGSSRKWNLRLDGADGWGFTSITDTHTLFASGANYDGVTTNPIFSIYNDGEWQFQMYPNTRDDSGSSTPINFLYTGVLGELKSAPIQNIVDVQTLLTSLPSYTDNASAILGGLIVGNSYYNTISSSYTRVV